MKLINKLQAGLRIAMAILFVGTTFQAGCLGTIARNVNPCGTIIDCNPTEWDYLFTEIPDFEVDPTCTVPGYCGSSQGPLPFPAGGGTVTDTTGDTTTTSGVVQ